MNLEVRISKKNAEVHLIDSSNNHPLSIIKTDLEALNLLLVDLKSKYPITSIKRSKKRLLTV